MVTLKDIQTIFINADYRIKRDDNNSRRFILSNKKGEILGKIKMPYTMDEFAAELQKLGVEKYIKVYDATNSKSKISSGPRNSNRKIKNNGRSSAIATGEKIPAALKSRKKALEARQKEIEKNSSITNENPTIEIKNDVVVKAQPTEMNYAGNFNSIQSAEAEATYINKKIDYKVSIPREHNGFYFPKFAGAMMNRVAIGRNSYLSGFSGCGKTSLVYNLADYLGIKLVRVNFSVGTTEQHLIGRWIVKNGETIFVHGIIPLAMKYGWWLLLDEIDFAMPEHMAILQPVLEGEPLLITQNRNEEIIPHENFRVFATGNTKGRGDESQSYSGTGNLNLAFLDRWSIFEMDYTDRESNIVMSIINDEVLTLQLVSYFKLLRKSVIEGTMINAVFSTRRLIQMAEALEFGESLKDVLEYEIYSRYDRHEMDLLKELSYDIWNKDHYMKGWKLGDKHHSDPVAAEANSADVNSSNSSSIASF